MTYRERHEQIKALRDQGLLLREIAAQVGLAVSTVGQYAADPTGEKTRARKAKNNGECIDCGAPTKDGGARIAPERCFQCATAETKRLPNRRSKSANLLGKTTWSDAEIFDAMRSVARDGVITSTPLTTDHCAAVWEVERGGGPSWPPHG
jgi:hypothetical protein